jgi:hypothetical protein
MSAFIRVKRSEWRSATRGPGPGPPLQNGPILGERASSGSRELGPEEGELLLEGRRRLLERWTVRGSELSRRLPPDPGQHVPGTGPSDPRELLRVGPTQDDGDSVETADVDQPSELAPRKRETQGVPYAEVNRQLPVVRPPLRGRDRRRRQVDPARNSELVPAPHPTSRTRAPGRSHPARTASRTQGYGRGENQGNLRYGVEE